MIWRIFSALLSDSKQVFTHLLFYIRFWMEKYFFYCIVRSRISLLENFVCRQQSLDIWFRYTLIFHISRFFMYWYNKIFDQSGFRELVRDRLCFLLLNRLTQVLITWFLYILLYRLGFIFIHVLYMYYIKNNWRKSKRLR